jgi:hypothetical protein
MLSGKPPSFLFGLIALGEFPGNISLGKRTSMPLEHLCPLFQCHMDLITQRDEATCEVHVVFPKQSDGDEDEVDVMEDESGFIGVDLLTLEKGIGVLPPVPHRIQMVRGVIAVVEAVAVAL